MQQSDCRKFRIVLSIVVIIIGFKACGRGTFVSGELVLDSAHASNGTGVLMVQLVKVF